MAEQTISQGQPKGILDRVVGAVGSFLRGPDATKTGVLPGGLRYDPVKQSISRIESPVSQTIYPDMGQAQPDQGVDNGAAVAQAQALAQARAGWGAQRDNYMGSINQMINDQTTGLNRNAEDYYMSAQQAQSALDQKGAQNELARIQGRTSILDRVGDQTRSAGVMLGQKNAGNSSAAQALANAYGTLGNRDVQKVEQGYAVNNEGLNTEQQQFNQANQVKTRRFEEDKANTINSIINEASAQIQALNNAAAGASLPDRVAIQAEQQRIRNEASARLQSFDSQVAAARGIQGQSVEQRRGEANRLNTAGNAATMFNLTPEQNPQTVQQGNAFEGGNLPLYTAPRKRLV